MSSYNGTELSDKLIDEVLNPYGEERVDKHKYLLVDTPDGSGLMEYDENGEYVKYRQGQIQKKTYEETYKDVEADLRKYKQRNENTKYLRYFYLCLLAMAFLLAIAVILIFK